MLNRTVVSLSLVGSFARSPLVASSFGCAPMFLLSRSRVTKLFSPMAFISSPYKLNLDCSIFESTIGNFVRISKSSCPTSAYTVSSGESFSISNCAMSGATSFSTYIECSSATASVCITSSSFTSMICSSGTATLAIDNAYNITVFSTIFDSCATNDVSAYRVASHVNNIPYGSFNSSVEVHCGSSTYTYDSSYFGARTQSIFSKNNATQNFAASLRSGFCFTNSPSTYPIATFSLATGCQGKAFLSLYAGDATMLCECLSFVNNSVSRSWIEVGTATTGVLTLMTFVRNTQISQTIYSTVSYSISFLRCVFDNTSALQSQSVFCSGCLFAGSFDQGFSALTCDAIGLLMTHAFTSCVKMGLDAAIFSLAILLV